MSVCSKCGTINEEGYTYCIKCGNSLITEEPQNFFTMADSVPLGTPQFPPQPSPETMYYLQQQKLQNDVSNAKLLGILALIFGFLLPIGAFISGGICLSKLKQIPFVPYLENDKANARTMSIVGIVLASVRVLIVLLYWIAVIGIFSTLEG